MKTGNIVIVGNSPFRPSGGGILADHLLRLLPSAGHAVRAIYPIYGDKSAWPGLIHRRYPQVEVFWYEMPYLADVFAGIAAEDLALQAQGITAGLRRFVASQRPDLIYLHKESSTWGMPALLRELELPLLSTPHGNLLAMVNGATENTQAGEWLETYRQADLITCCAEHMTVRLRAAGLTDLVTVPNGVELERFRPRPRPPALAAEVGVAADDIVVLHASDLKAIKRPLDGRSRLRRSVSSRSTAALALCRCELHAAIARRADGRGKAPRDRRAREDHELGRAPRDAGLLRTGGHDSAGLGFGTLVAELPGEHGQWPHPHRQ